MHPIIRTSRLVITYFDESMAKNVHLNSLDQDNRRFVPDEVFETEQDAKETIMYLIECYQTTDGPFVYPIVLNSGENIGYVQAIPISDEWEVGYHIAEKFTNKGYATEALSAFVPYVMEKIGIKQLVGVCHGDNIASRKVLEKCGFNLIFQSIESYHGQQQNVYKYIYKI